MTLVAVVGSGLAGLVAALSAREGGAEVVVLDRAGEPGGTTVLSSGWIWRYRDMKTFRWGAPHGDSDLQRAIYDELPDALTWLERMGAKFVARGTANALTDGVRVDPVQAVERLAERLPGDALLFERQVTGASADGARVVLRTTNAQGNPGTLEADAVIFAGGGYADDLERLARESGTDDAAAAHWTRRNAGLSDGSAQAAAAELGAHMTPITGEFYGRAMPVGVRLWPDDYVRFSQVYSEHALVVDDRGRLVPRRDHDWSNAQMVFGFARATGRAWYLLDREALLQVTPYGIVQASVKQAASAGALVLESGRGMMQQVLAEHELEIDPRRVPLIESAVCAIAVRPGVTHTVNGLRIDTDARVKGPRRSKLRLYAAGADAGGIADGGYASGLAQALALGRIAGRNAAI